MVIPLSVIPFLGSADPLCYLRLITLIDVYECTMREVFGISVANESIQDSYYLRCELHHSQTKVEIDCKLQIQWDYAHWCMIQFVIVIDESSSNQASAQFWVRTKGD